jgi:beta-1,4-mannooligosaccharide/beta-1,4-mannosyl-N-acetylglucosamine phosphorylase
MQDCSHVLKRYPGNPVLTADDVPYESTLVFNAGVVKFQGHYVMVFRNDYGCEGEGQMHGTNLGLAHSLDGLDWQVEPEPCWSVQTDEIQRVYDPRITIVEERSYLCFAVDTHHGIRGGIAHTPDFQHYDILSMSAPDNRNMVLFPDKLRGNFVRLERPFPMYMRPGQQFDVWYSESPDGMHWGNARLVLAGEQVPWCNAKIGPGAPPIRTSEGWLTFFHAVQRHDDRELPAWHSGWRKEYMAGLMLLDLDEPWRVKAMAPGPVLRPEEDYELEGYRGSVIFPTGAILEDSGEVKVYYGAADTVMALATAHVDDLLDICEEL